MVKRCASRLQTCQQNGPINFLMSEGYTLRASGAVFPRRLVCSGDTSGSLEKNLLFSVHKASWLSPAGLGSGKT